MSVIESIVCAGTGEIRLIRENATDMSVVDSARVSFGKVTDGLNEQVTDEKDSGLIRFLMENKHGTPFEHNSMTFYVKAPIFVARQWFRHRIASYNEVSGRYSELKDTFWSPDIDSLRTQVGKPGAYSFKPYWEEHGYDKTHQMIAVFEDNIRMCRQQYEFLLNNGVSKEQARSVLPVSYMTEFYWTVNARSLMNFLELRTDAHAQAEIREYALAAEQIWKKLMPVTHHFFVTNGRKAP